MHQSSESFYNEFVVTYDEYALNKEAYLLAVNKFIWENTGIITSIVDVGAGTGKRSKKVFKSLNAKKLTLIDSSEGMVNMLKEINNATVIKADISDYNFKHSPTYDVVVCLWNVLGHIPQAKRITTLKNIASLVQVNGSIFLDVNNRYNISHYGLRSVFKNFLRDLFFPKDSNGDFPLCVNADNGPVNTSVHIFNPFEIRRLIKTAGLTIERCSYINYRNGDKSRLWFCGQIVFKLKKS